MRWITESSLQLRGLVIVIAAIVMFLGIVALRAIPVGVFPEFEPPTVEIQTEAPGLSAVEVEAMVTVPLEEMLVGTAQLESLRSESVPGLSSIQLIFEEGTDPIRVRQLVQERLIAVHLMPAVTRPPVMLQPLSATSRVMMVGLTSDEMSLIDMSVLGRWTVVPKLLGIPGVANVAIWGERERQLQVDTEPDKLGAEGVTPDQVISSSGDALWVSPLGFLNASVPGTGGWIESPNQRIGIRHVLPISSPDDLAQVPVDGTSLILSDIAEVVEGHPPVVGGALLNSEPGLLLVVEKFPGSDTLEVTRGVEAAMEELRPGLQGVDVDTSVFRTATFIESAVSNLTTALIVASILVALVVALFHFSWRTAVIGLVTIPLSVLTAGLILYLRGETVNALVLTGFIAALLVIIDGSIVVTGNIARRLRESRGTDGAASGDSPASTIVQASAEVGGPIAVAAVIVALAVFPIFLITGPSGAFFEPLVLSYVLAVSSSVLVALVVTPALSMILMSNAPGEANAAPFSSALRRGYQAVLSRNARAPRLVYTAAGIILVGSIAVWAVVALSSGDQRVQVPSFQETDLLVEVEAAPGTSHPEMVRILSRISDELHTIAGVDNIGINIGRAVSGDQIVAANSGQLWINIDPDARYDETVTGIEDTVDGYPGLRAEVQPYLRDRIGDVLAGAEDPIVVRVFGPGLDVLGDKAEEVKQSLIGINGLADLRVETPITEPHIEVEVDLERSRSFGLKPGDVRRAAATAFAGLEVGSLFEDQKVFRVVVWSTAETHHSLDNIVELMIDTPGGDQVRLGDVADVLVVSAPQVVKKDATSHYIDVVASVDGRPVDAVARDVEARLELISFPIEYNPTLLGDYAEQQDENRRLLIFAASAVVGVFLMLHASLGSWRLAALAFLVLQAILASTVVIAAVADSVYSLSSLAAFLAILGLATRTGILQIKYLQRLENQVGRSMSDADVVQGAGVQLGPIVATFAAAGLTLVTVLAFGGNAGMEIAQPLALVALGGLIVSTLLNLLLVPALYLKFSSGPLTEAQSSQLSTTRVPADPS